MKQTRLEQMKDRMLNKLGPEQGAQVGARMEEEFRILCEKDSEKSPDLIRHLHNNIFPVVAAFHALMQSGMERKDAAGLAQDAFLELMEDTAASLRRLCRIPGLYRMIPWLFGKLMPSLFKKEAGFVFTFHRTGRGHVRFDMEACPYLETCRELDCPELAPVFCKTDDVCYGHMHPRLCWNRTQTLARGGALCDFDLQLMKSKQDR